MSNRINLSSGAPWEDVVGYSRAVRIGNVIEVSGTAPVEDGEVLDGDAYEQATLCLQIIERSLADLGASLADVVRTRMFVTDISKWEEIGRAHHEFFGSIKPATSMVEVNKLIEEGMLLEIEATAYVPQ